jgi:hypothetical protein
MTKALAYQQIFSSIFTKPWNSRVFNTECFMLRNEQKTLFGSEDRVDLVERVPLIFSLNEESSVVSWD